MRQRAVIAGAMAGRPTRIIADVPTTAPDATVRAQVLDLPRRRRAETGAAIVPVARDLGVVAEVARRVAVMAGGRIVAPRPVDAPYARARHACTTALLESPPRLGTGAAGSSRFRASRRCRRHCPGAARSPRAAGWARGAPAARSRIRRCAPSGGGAAAAGRVAEARAAPKAPKDAPGHARACGRRGAAARGARPQAVFPVRSRLLRLTRGHVRAVDGVSLTVRAGETVSLPGESGRGKTTAGRAGTGLVAPGGGDIRFEGRSIPGLRRVGMHAPRRHMRSVPPDPFPSPNPVLPVEDTAAKPLRVHGLCQTMGAAREIARLVEMMGPSATMFGRYPRSFPGERRLRIGIARALGVKPKLVIPDAPVAALDISIEAQILHLLGKLPRNLGLGCRFVARSLRGARRARWPSLASGCRRRRQAGARCGAPARPICTRRGATRSCRGWP